MLVTMLAGVHGELGRPTMTRGKTCKPLDGPGRIVVAATAWPRCSSLHTFRKLISRARRRERTTSNSNF